MISIPSSDKKFTLPIQIRFNDVDLAKHVNNSIYQNYFDLAKTHWYNQMFGELIDWKETGLVLAHIEIDYYAPTYIDDPIVVESYITKIGAKSFEHIQVVRMKDSKAEDGVKCVSRSVMVAYNYEKNHSFQIPEAWNKRLKEYLV